MATVLTDSAAILARCVLDFFYNIASTILKILQTLIAALIALVDAKILQLRAIITQLDIINNLLDFAWAIIEGVLNQLKDLLLGGVQELGPPMSVCPEFYNYFVDPVLAIIESFSVFTDIKERLQVSFRVLTYFNKLLVYWESLKVYLTAASVVIEDALYRRLSEEALSA